MELNQVSYLHQKLSNLYPSLTWERVNNACRTVSEDKYKFLLALYFNKKNAELDAELSKIGVLND